MGAGLTRSTTIDLIDELVARGLVRELPNARATGAYTKGRPARRFEFDASAAVVVGVDAGRAHMIATVADLRGELLGEKRRDLDVDLDSAEVRREAISELVDEALAAVERSRTDVISLCVGVPAPVDGEGRSPHHRDDFWQRMNPDFRELFQSTVPLVRVENDAVLAAVAEGALGEGIGCTDFIALLSGERLGAGVVVDGRLLRGAHGGVGEMVAFDHVPDVAGAWGLGFRAAHMAQDRIRAGDYSPTSALGALRPEDVDAKLVLDLARRGDPDASAIVTRIGELLAKVVGVFGSLFDPARVIISGGVAEGAEGILAAARLVLPELLDLPAPELVVSRLGSGVVTLGALRHAVDEARAHVLDLDRDAVGAGDRR